MNLLNNKVKHITLGQGNITAQDDKYILVEFTEKTSKFAYSNPDTFTKFLQVEDTAVQEAILQEIAYSNNIVEAKKLAEEEFRERTEEKCEVKTAKRKTRAMSHKKAPVRIERIPGKRMTFCVFQGATYDRESRGGYIWAPVSNKSGNTFHHWDRLLDVRLGDTILHGYDGYVQAVSTAISECYEHNQPAELRTENLWEQKGRRIDCDYIHIERPIKTSAFRHDIIRLCNVKYAPFDKYGSGNMGYLYEINRELARIFLLASSKNNHYLKDVGYILDLLAEGTMIKLTCNNKRFKLKDLESLVAS